MPRILKRDEVAKITTHNRYPVNLDIEDLAHTLAARDRLIAAMNARPGNAFLSTLASRVGLGCFDEHDAAALGRWEEMNGMVKK